MSRNESLRRQRRKEQRDARIASRQASGRTSRGTPRKSPCVRCRLLNPPSGFAERRRQCRDCAKLGKFESPPHPLRGIWVGIRQRCTNPNVRCADRYLGRGITYCAGYDSLAYFASDMGPRPTEKHEVDRIDGTNGYWCGSCEECASLARERNVRWASVLEQQQNKAKVRRLTWQGRTQCVTDWDRELGLPMGTVGNHLAAGWPTERIMTAPYVGRPKLTPEQMEWKRCPKCGATKRRTDFYVDKTKSGTARAYCKPCMRAYNSQHQRRAVNGTGGDTCA